MLETISSIFSTICSGDEKMEKQKTLKRGREEEADSQIKLASENDAKKQDLHGLEFSKSNEGREGSTSKASESRLAFGVFDFPWLKDGVVSKSEDYDYRLDIEDKILSSLEVEDKNFKDAGFGLFKEQWLCETPEESLVHFPEELEENVWLPFERDGLEFNSEDGNCVYSSILNQPLK